ncbi:MAG: ABC transporter ATP-binding protein [Ferruginibacter sp.]
MAESLIEVENLSKIYKLGKIGTGTLSHDLNRWWQKVRGKEDSYHKLGPAGINSDKDFIWCLKDLNFSVEKGEVFGIIGKNGAGKSTLLKILSKITKPTTGIIRLGGRVGSLLEVGTGFHPELTGKENVYLNGAILGMKQAEIRKKYDQIVSFSGVEKFIDTPVKRYSSGMFVRLAFAVAAHLEPEILIVDEVLAVGDHEFQQKCLGKMKDVSANQGRTILFVSHNTTAVKHLCTRAMLLEQGAQKAIGSIDDILSIYHEEIQDTEAGKRGKFPTNLPGYFLSWKLEGRNLSNEHACYTGDTCLFSFRFRALEFLKNCEVRLMIRYKDMIILHTSSLAHNGTNFSIDQGDYNFKFKVDFPVRHEKFDVEVSFVTMGTVQDIWLSSTKLIVLDHHGSHLFPGLINPATRFYMENEVAEHVNH